MTILYLSVCIIAAFLLGVIVCNYYFVIPVQQSNSRLIGKLNQKEWQIMHWQLAYNKANEDFMKLAKMQQPEIDNSQTKEESNENQAANIDDWVGWAWTEDKPYPETLETKVVVMFRDGHRCPYSPETVGWWHSGDISANNWYNSGDTNDIVAYRVVN